MARKRSGRAGARVALILRLLATVAVFVAALVRVNAYSFRHYLRFDWTGRTFAPAARKLDRFPYYDVSLLAPSGRFPMQFTLPAEIADELRKLRAPTTIVVYQRHKTF